MLALKKLFFAVVLLVVALFSVRHLPWNLDSYDQAKQAFVSYQMIGEGAWWFQHTPDGASATKPPLAGWISALLYFVTGGHWFAAWIIPSFASGLALLWLLDRGAFQLARASEVDPWLLRSAAAGAFGLNLMAPHLATLVRTDMLLSFLLFIPGYLIWRKQRETSRWTTGERVVFAVAVLATMMTKGPLIATFVVPGVAACGWLLRRRGVPFHGWPGWWPWLLPLGLFLVWTGAGILWQPGFFEDVVVKEFAGRVTGEHRSQPVYYYAGQLLYRLAPWSVLLLGLAVARRGRELVRQRPEVLWLACWTLGALLVMSLIPSKRTDRIFPIVPPACLWLVSLIAHGGPGRWLRLPRRTVLVGCVVVAALFASVYAGAKIHGAYREQQGALVEFGRRARAFADEHDWPLEVASGRDEGLPMYAGTRRFLPRKKLRELWRRGTVASVILPLDQLEKFQRDLPGGRVYFQSAPSSESGESYAFYAR